MTPQQIAQQLTAQLSRLMAATEEDRQQMEKAVSGIVQAAIGKLELVNREEFEAQTKVLLRTREKLEAAEQHLEHLRTQLEALEKSLAP